MEFSKPKTQPTRIVGGLPKGNKLARNLAQVEQIPSVRTDTEKSSARVESSPSTYTKIDFDKTDLFFKSKPNKIAFDKVKIKNTGTTCIYFKWQKSIKPFNLPEKKSDGIDRFFCHYSDSKLFPDEEKEFVFSFFSEKNGVFQEDWVLVTSPPIKNAHLSVHLSGMCMNISDKYSNSVATLESDLQRKAVRTLVEEMVLDLISTIREESPPQPDMSDPQVFKMFFLKHNREYNVQFSSYIMSESTHVLNLIHDALGTGEEGRYWNGSMDVLKSLCRDSSLDGETRDSLLFKIETLIHLSRRKNCTDSIYIDYMANKMHELALEFNDTANAVKEDFGLFPSAFDFYTRQGLVDKEVTGYKNEQNKRKDEFYKKIKKKALKPEEEEKEYTDYRNKLTQVVKEKFLEKMEAMDSLVLDLESKVLNSYTFDEDYIDRLVRVKSLKSAKSDGIDGKVVILRVDIEDFEFVYQNKLDEEENVVGREIKEVNFPNAKETFLQSTSFLLDNRAKAVVLLVDFGPKIGEEQKDFSVKFLKEYLERESLLEQSISLVSLSDLSDLQRRIDSEDIRDNSLLIVENLNFCPEECGYEIETDPNLAIHAPEKQMLKYYSKLKWLNLVSLKSDERFPPAPMFVLDSYKSILKNYPSVIDMQNEMKCLGFRLESKLHKLTNFLSIGSANTLLIMGDNEGCDTYTEKDLLNSLLTLHSLLPRFKKVFLLGKLAMKFIHFSQNDYSIGDYKTNPLYHPLMKYLLVRADLLGVGIYLPCDGLLLRNSEFEKFKDGYKFKIFLETETKNLILDKLTEEDESFNNQQEEFEEVVSKEPIIIEDYPKYIKKLFKMEKKLIELNALKLDPDELLEHEDYVKNKLTEEERNLIEFYKNNSIEFETGSHRENFVHNQGAKKPKKILKNELEERHYLESIYRSEVILPIHEENFSKKVDLSLENSEVYQLNTNPNQNSHVTSHQITSRSLSSNPLYDFSESTFFDWGEKTYEKLNSVISEVNMVMWLGKLSPSHIENLNDNYSKLVRTVYERKGKLKTEYNENVQEEDKKSADSEQKAKRYLFNFFLKSKTSYEQIRKSFLSFMLPAEDMDSEVPPDEEQFNHEMNLLIDYSIVDECSFINSILTGEHVPGLFGVSAEPKKDKEPELDLKFLEEIY